MLLRYLAIILTASLCHGAFKSSERSENGTIATDDDRKLVNNTVVTLTAQVVEFHQPSSALRRDILMGAALTAGPANSQLQAIRDESFGDLCRGTEEKFIFAETKTSYNGEEIKMYALQVAPEGENAYWVPKGGYLDIPATPNSSEPKLVFTPDLSGCSITVTALNNNKYRVRHIEGDKDNKLPNNITISQVKDTLTLAVGEKTIVNIKAFAFLYFTAGDNWELMYQVLDSPPTVGGFKFDSTTKHLSTMVLNQPISEGKVASQISRYGIIYCS